MAVSAGSFPCRMYIVLGTMYQVQSYLHNKAVPDISGTAIIVHCT